jgi:hypothetical protein
MDLWGIEIAKEEQEHKFGAVLRKLFTSKNIIHKNSSSNQKKNPSMW